MSRELPCVGIDLGTTNSLCAVFENGVPRLIPNAHGAELTPSVVGLLESGEIIVGETAKSLMLTQPERATAAFKRWMGQDRKVELGKQSFTPPELSSFVLRALAKDAEAYLGAPIDEVVVTVPAYFNEHQRRATRMAGELAGLTVRRVVNEPTAAALAHGYHNSQGIRNLLVFDLGGGTFDVTVMEVFEDTLEILATAGESHLGGEDFTDRILGWALGEVGLVFEHEEVKRPRLVSRLRDEAEKAKVSFTSSDEAELRLPDSEGVVDSGAQRLTLGAAHFEELCESLVKRLAGPTNRAMRGARLAWDQIDDVLMVGGATRMPVVRRWVSDLLGRAPQAEIDPDRVVALGAAVQAALIADDKAVEDLVMTDVCPFTLGIEITKELGRREVDGYYLPVIHRNTTIPVSCEEIVHTLRPNQTRITLRIYQGEARRVEGNLKLGELEVTGIPAGPPGQEIAVRFTYDLSGLVEVECYIPKTQAKFRTVLTHGVSGLDEEEYKEAVKRLQKLKYYPRDDLENQRLLKFAEAVLKELEREGREYLEAFIDHFEHAMSLGNRETFGSAKQNLLEFMAEQGFEFPGQRETGEGDG